MPGERAQSEIRYARARLPRALSALARFRLVRYSHDFRCELAPRSGSRRMQPRRASVPAGAVPRSQPRMRARSADRTAGLSRSYAAPEKAAQLQDIDAQMK